jgi:two-component system nitrogen regulation response regulator NtrX
MTSSGARLLVVDDEGSIRDVLKQLFEYEGHEVRVAGDGAAALEAVRDFQPHVTFLDVKMPGLDGLEALTRIRDASPSAVVVMISGHGTIDTAIEATRKGAYDFLEKPLDTDRLLVTLRNALERQGLNERVSRLRTEVEARHQIVGNSFRIRQVVERLEKVAPTDARVLISGENGTGKELVARAIHRLSPRSNKAFVEVNCAAIPSELIESELFGHIKGSFTGAVADRAGRFEQADGGTLFLDEVGDMSSAVQAKVLRALEEGVVTRVGGSKSVRVDVRVVAATNKDLSSEIAEGRFREDLFYRLNVVPIHVPPLRERREDIPLLVDYFLARAVHADGVRPRPVSEAAMALLCSLRWPGNVRELRNTIERLLILAPGEEIDRSSVELLVTGPAGDSGLGGELASASTYAEFKDRAERAFILQKLRENDWNISETARSVEMPRSNLYKKIEKYGLVREDAPPAL